jgi:quinoprotein dehydrogenase-associated probable ABC transporter substrate-binding protein
MASLSDSIIRSTLPGLRAGTLLLGLLAVAGIAPAADEAEPTERDAFRVCSDPNNLPFSNKAGEGFENKIAQVMAADLGLPVEYAWYPMQMGFARKTLGEYLEAEQRYRCDVIIGTTSGLEGKTTEPYYYSSYALVYRRDAGLGELDEAADLLQLSEAQRQDLRIGVFAGSPVTNWLLRNGFAGAMVPYKHQSGSMEVTPGSILRDHLADGDLDMIAVWGPIGGYFVDRLRNCGDCAHNDLGMVLMPSDQGQRYHYGISMGVRYGNDEWLATIQKLIHDNRREINAILREYNVPLVNAAGEPVGDANR